MAQAGRKGAVTVAADMAGRGTDIMLGGNPESLIAAELEKSELTEEEHPDACREVRERVTAAVGAAYEEVEELGGLYVLGTAREFRRIDNQLRGRSGHQGDNGASTSTYLEDDLMRLFRAQVVDRVMAMANVPDDIPIENKMVTRAIASAQAQVEQQHFESARTASLKFDEVLNRQRTLIYAERRRVLAGRTCANSSCTSWTTPCGRTSDRRPARASPRNGIWSGSGAPSHSSIRCGSRSRAWRRRPATARTSPPRTWSRP